MDSQRRRFLGLTACAVTLPFGSRRAHAQMQPTDHTITVNGLRLHYLGWGDPTRRPMILLHGIGRSALLAVLVGDPGALGKVRYYVRKAVPELVRAL